MDPNERFRARRAGIRRRKRLRRAATFGVALAAVIALAAGMTLAGKGSGPNTAAPKAAAEPVAAAASAPAGPQPRPLPVEIRGVHVTGALASLPGKLKEYVGYTKYGLNTIELDIKDEGGIVNFVPSSVPLAQRIGASRPYFKPRQVARLAHDANVYLIGRLVVFQDPVLARARPDLAIRTPEGGAWQTSGGLAWVNPYDRRVWNYAVSVAEAAARAGFDEIMLDYVRFPSDGDTARAVYPGRTSQNRRQLITDFAAYASKRLEPLGVRVSTALFGLSATRDMGLGQSPKLIAEHVDIVSPMAYPALYGGGELGIESPSAEPGETVFRTLADFRRAVKESGAQLVPWIQDWNYSPREVRQQIEAVRLMGAKGYLLWNAAGRYTRSALAAQATG
ncbi:MAG: putative glycoside hydrolase [Thermoleophilia bacterium]|nr:putative glycoside hydrolase [Thermoleophilia bacterium]MDH4345191.1 putative glycoside hydrolase [Thermoleophilia bacterium]MDH5334230.1 putative glycoside hydrolase [Thermoleophilia bacterium]